MKVLVSGSTGLVGTALCRSLESDGHDVVRLVRSDPGPAAGDRVRWDPARGTLDAENLSGLDGVVHLAGENIASGRWSEDRKARIRGSRVEGTKLLCDALSKVDRKPSVFVGASAIGYYGERGDEVVDEGSAMGEGFLAEVSRDWEAAAAGLQYEGIRVTHARIGAVLAKDGGLLQRVAMLFRLGLGGRLGDGRQSMSWVSLDDLVAILRRALEDDAFRGPVNAVSPSPVTNAEFTRVLGRVLKRPTILPVPAFALRFVLGEMADALLLSSCRVRPRRLEEAGYHFLHPDLEGALRAELSR